MSEKIPESPSSATMNEYTIGLHTLNLGDGVRKAQNPFTSEPMEFPIDDGMSESELASVLDVLKDAGASQPDEDGYRHVALSNGTRVGFGGLPKESRGSIQSLEVELLTKKDFSITEASFVLQIATAGNLFISSPVDPDVVATVRPVDDPRFSKRYRHHSVVADPRELIGWIHKNISFREVVDELPEP